MTSERAVREREARQAWTALPHGGRDAVILQVHCAAGHHLAKVADTPVGRVVVSTLRSRSHGDRDRPDSPHTPDRAHVAVDLLDVLGDDVIPAWCDCGHRVLSRAVLITWVQAHERRVVMA